MNLSFADKKDDFFDLVSESHLLASQIKRESIIGLSRNFAADSAALDSKKAIEFKNYQNQLDTLIFDLYKKQFLKEFTKVEIDYLKAWYAHPLSKKVTAFNAQFLRTSEVQSTIKAKADSLKKEFLISPKVIQQPIKK